MTIDVPHCGCENTYYILYAFINAISFIIVLSEPFMIEHVMIRTIVTDTRLLLEIRKYALYRFVNCACNLTTSSTLLVSVTQNCISTSVFCSAKAGKLAIVRQCFCDIHILVSYVVTNLLINKAIFIKFIE